MDPPGDSVWLLLQLLVPAVHRPLWEATRTLQQAVLASGPRVSPQSKVRFECASARTRWSVVWMCPGRGLDGQSDSVL